MSYTLDQLPVLILAGGLGTRLRPMVADRPKCMAPVGDSIFLEIIIKLLKQQGVKRFIMCIGYKGEMVSEYFGSGDSLEVEINYSDEGEQLMGTAGAIRKALPLIGERAVVINGDTYFAISYADLLAKHELYAGEEGLQLTVALSQKEDCSQCGSVSLNQFKDRVTGFFEKGTQPDGSAGWVNAGVYVMERAFVERIPTGMPRSLERDSIPAEIDSGRLPGAYLARTPFFDIGTPASLEAFRRYFGEINRG